MRTSGKAAASFVFRSNFDTGATIAFSLSSVLPSGSTSPSALMSFTCLRWKSRIAACVFGPLMPSTLRNGIGPPGSPCSATWFSASWMVLTSAGILRAQKALADRLRDGDRPGDAGGQGGRRNAGTERRHHQKIGHHCFLAGRAKTHHRAGHAGTQTMRWSGVREVGATTYDRQLTAARPSGACGRLVVLRSVRRENRRAGLMSMIAARALRDVIAAIIALVVAVIAAAHRADQLGVH